MILQAVAEQMIDLAPLASAFAPYDSGIALASLGALQLIPANAHRLIPLEMLAHAVAAIASSTSYPLTPNKLRQLCNHADIGGAFRSLEDPPENPFMERTFFVGGSYRVL